MKLTSILSQLINESYILLEEGGFAYPFTGPKIEIDSPSDKTVYYNFTTKGGSKYEVKIECAYSKNNPDHKWACDVSFDVVTGDSEDSEEFFSFDEPEEGSPETGENDMFRVMATVLAIMEKFIIEFKPEFLTYSGILSGKEGSGTSEMTKRDRIYDAMVRKAIGRLPMYRAERVGFNMEVSYTGDLPVPGHNEIFNYPKK